LTLDLHRRRFEIPGPLPPILGATKLDSFRMLVTGNESWFMLEHSHSTNGVWPEIRSQRVAFRSLIQPNHRTSRSPSSIPRALCLLFMEYKI
jgi:hypothetical protein